MKKIVILFLSVILTSCTSYKKVMQNYIINDIKESEKKYKCRDKALIDRKIDFNKALLLLSFKGVLMRTEAEKIAFDNLKRKYINDTLTKFWTKDDFKKIDFAIIKEDDYGSYCKKMDSLLMKNFDKYKSSRITQVYKISQPYLINKQELFFYVYKSDCHSSLGEFLIFLEKKGNKWIFKERFDR